MLRGARRPRLLLLGVVLAVLGVLAGVVVYRQANSRVGIVVAARTVAFGHVVSREDLREVALPAGTGLATIAWSDVDSVIGRTAATDLLTGLPVAPEGVTSAGPPQAGFAVVGIAVGRGHAPGTPLVPRDQVLVVGISAAAAATPATVLRAGEPDAAGKRTVDLIVPEAVAADLVRASADDRAALVLVARR